MARAGQRVRTGWRGPVVNAVVVGTVLLAGVLAWRRRWISDDGLVVVRTARQIVAGHGPVYNIGERAEATTSPAWTWLLAMVSWISTLDAAHVAVFLGGLLGAVGLGFAVDGSRRWWNLAIGSRPFPLPAGIVVLLALPPVWDFLTSGLETGLLFLWIGLSWWLLVLAAERERARSVFTVSIWLGLGPLVRPELSLVTLGFWIALVAATRSSLARTFASAAVGAALPVVYQVFRMGYYGLLVPLPAVAKEAAILNPRQGLLYLSDFVRPYLLWIPGILLVVLLLVAMVQFRQSSGPIGLALAPLWCGLLVGVYIVVVGGDYMHARLLLPALLLVLLPVLVIPATKTTAVFTVGVVAWSVVCGLILRPAYADLGPDRIDQERALFVKYTRDPHPIDEHAFALRGWAFIGLAATSARDIGRRELLYPDPGADRQLSSAPLLLTRQADLAIMWPNPGIVGGITGLEEDTVDPLGLAYPLAAHMAPSYRDRPGKAKLLDPVWAAADYSPAGIEAPRLVPTELANAQQALKCGPLSERLAASRAPLTWSRFWSNVAGATRRTGLRIPVDPAEARATFCG